MAGKPFVRVRASYGGGAVDIFFGRPEFDVDKAKYLVAVKIAEVAATAGRA